jgi:RHS repeat-associated protein
MVAPVCLRCQQRQRRVTALEARVGGQTKAQYVWSPVYVDTLVLRDCDTNGDGALDERLYVVQDANYNVTALLDNSGNVVERYVYDPFGAATVLDANWVERSSGSQFAWLYLHQGGRFDTASGLYHFRNRDYSPTLGRWTSLDPLRYDAGDVNLYRALGNKPLNRTDPFGLYELPWSPNASWQLEGSLLGEMIDGALEPIRIGGDLIRAGTQLGSLGTHALGWTDIYEDEPHSWLMQGWFRACDEGRGGEYLREVELGVMGVHVQVGDRSGN